MGRLAQQKVKKHFYSELGKMIEFIYANPLNKKLKLFMSKHHKKSPASNHIL